MVTQKIQDNFLILKSLTWLYLQGLEYIGNIYGLQGSAVSIYGVY
jgi:hypothetical protein